MINSISFCEASATHRKQGRSVGLPSPARARTAAEGILDDLGLKDLKRSLVSELPVAAQKRVNMATTLEACQPKLLLLDEVAAGLNPNEIEDIMASISASTTTWA